MPFGSRRRVARDPEIVLQEDETRLFVLANERLRREAQIWWPHEIFLTYNQAGTGHGVCPAIIDATGRARYLAFGPFHQLPPGRWRASLVLRVSATAALRPLAVEFGTPPNVAAYNLPYGVAGLHRIELENTFGPDDLSQFRLSVKRAAFQGEIGFLGVALHSLDAPADDTPSPESPTAC
jgi:hypothetical protein